MPRQMQTCRGFLVGRGLAPAANAYHDHATGTTAAYSHCPKDVFALAQSTRLSPAPYSSEYN